MMRAARRPSAKTGNPSATDIVGIPIGQYRTPARWAKAVQHLSERGLIEDSPRDIGKLIVEAAEDTERECADEIKQALYRWAWPKIRRGLSAGLPEWYKGELLARQFTPDAPVAEAV